MGRRISTYATIFALSWAAAATDNRENNTQAPSDAVGQEQAEHTPAAELTHKIRLKLMESPLSIESKNVTILASKQWVLLRGTVPNEQEKRTVERVAREVAKQRTVKSDLSVRE